MKKLASLGIAAVLLTQLLLPSFALGTEIFVSEESETPVQISTTGEAKWLVSFPADIVIPWEEENQLIGTVKAVKMHVEPNHAVQIHVTSQNDFKLVHETEQINTIPYNLLVGGKKTTDFAFGPGDIDKTFPLNAAITPKAWATAASGKHTDLLTFAITYVTMP